MDTSKKIEWILRVGVAGEFFGHGMLAIGGKADWIAWIGKIISVSTPTATNLLLLIGISDLIVAAIVLVRPMRPVLLWATFWGFWTALLRPVVMYLGVTNVGWLDFIERFANWAAPLALWYLLRSSKK